MDNIRNADWYVDAMEYIHERSSGPFAGQSLSFSTYLYLDTSAEYEQAEMYHHQVSQTYPRNLPGLDARKQNGALDYRQHGKIRRFNLRSSGIRLVSRGGLVARLLQRRYETISHSIQ